MDWFDLENWIGSSINIEEGQKELLEWKQSEKAKYLTGEVAFFPIGMLLWHVHYYLLFTDPGHLPAPKYRHA